MLNISTFTLGPVATNTYLVADDPSGRGVVIDPAWDGRQLAEEILDHGLVIDQIWLTHAHFDHFGGLADLQEALQEAQGQPVEAGMHPRASQLWEAQGGAAAFGIQLPDARKPSIRFYHGQGLQVGEHRFRVIHAPGHSAGHVMFHCRDSAVLFAGDVIFQQGIGRTDLLGGDYQTLMDSIRREVLVLTDETRIYPGHGPATTVEEEKNNNPFLTGR